MNIQALREIQAKFQLETNGMSNYPPCRTLKDKKRDCQLTLNQLAGLMFALQFLEGIGEVDYGQSPPVFRLGDSEIPLSFLEKDRARDWLESHIKTQVDITHLSKFLRGTQFPWDSVRTKLTQLFSILEGEDLDVLDVFPELKEAIQIINADKGEVDRGNKRPRRLPARKRVNPKLYGDIDLTEDTVRVIRGNLTS